MRGMRVSAKTDYALRALLEMSSRTDGKPVSAEELGRLQDIPHGFLQAILADLRKAGWSSPSAASPAAGG
jgi:DNA-binding IscR family transcriptional regulator